MQILASKLFPIAQRILEYRKIKFTKKSSEYYYRISIPENHISEIMLGMDNILKIILKCGCTLYLDTNEQLRGVMCSKHSAKALRDKMFAKVTEEYIKKI